MSDGIRAILGFLLAACIIVAVIALTLMLAGILEEVAQ